MEIRTEADHQQARRQLEHLLGHEHTASLIAVPLSDVANTCEEDNGHRSVPPTPLIIRLEHERLERQLNDQQLAELLIISPESLRAVWNGQRHIDLDLAKRLPSRLGMLGTFILEAA